MQRKTGRGAVTPALQRPLKQSAARRAGDQGKQGRRQPNRPVWRGLLLGVPGGGPCDGADQAHQRAAAVVLGVRRRQPPVQGGAPVCLVCLLCSPGWCDMPSKEHGQVLVPCVVLCSGLCEQAGSQRARVRPSKQRCCLWSLGTEQVHGSQLLLFGARIALLGAKVRPGREGRVT